MATNTTTRKAQPTTTRKAQPTTTTATPVGTTTTTATPVGTTTTTAVGTPQAQHPALAHLVATLGVALANPNAAWPGYGKAVRLEGGGSVYVNRANLDVRSTPTNVAKWAKAGHGVARGPQQQYLRVAYSTSGTAK